MFTQPNPNTWGWDDVKKLQKPLTASQVCTSVSNAPNLQHVKMRLGKHGNEMYRNLVKSSTINYNS